MQKDKKTAPRLIDLADMAGFSLATISRALTGHPGISEATKERVK